MGKQRSAARKMAKQGKGEWREIAPPDPRQYPDLAGSRAVTNNIHMVIIKEVETPQGVVQHLHIQRLDRRPIHKWESLQQIKNEICGAQAEAVEIYPPQSEVVNSCHHYHLWVLPEGIKMPFGLGRNAT
jgi:hypothetical protein